MARLVVRASIAHNRAPSSSDHRAHMKYLITGITGFAGPHLANLLIRDGHAVFGLVRESNGREQDIRDIVPDEIYTKLGFVYGDLTHFRSLDRIFKDETFDGV